MGSTEADEGGWAERMVLQGLPLAAIACGLDLRVVDWNPAAERIFGYTAAEARGRELADLLAPPSARDALRRVLTDLGSKKSGAKTTRANVTKDGRVILCEWWDSALVGPAGRVLGITSIAQDVTERAAAERVQTALFQIAEQATKATSLFELSRAIHQIIGGLLPARNFYIAIQDSPGLLTFPYFVDEHDAPPPPQPIGRGLTGYVLRTGKPLLATPEVFQRLIAESEIDLMGARSVDWLGVPLTSEGETYGVVAVQTYDPSERYGDRDRELLSFVSRQIASAVDRKRHEEELKKRERRFRALVENGSDVMLLVGADGRVREASESVKRTLGYLPGEMHGRSGLAFMMPEVHDSVRKTFDALVKEPGATSYGVYPARHRDGSRHWVEALTSNLLEEPAVKALVINFRDVTERRAQEEKLRESERLLDLFFSQSLDGFFFMMLDEPIRWDDTVDKEKTLDWVFTHQRLTKVNQAMLDQYGAKEETLLGRTPADFFALDVQAGRRLWRRLFDEGRLREASDERRLDGTPIWIEGDYICLYDADGCITGHFGIQRDVTERRRAEAEIRASEARYRHLFERNLAGVFRVTVEGRVLDANEAAARIFGFSTREDFLARRTLELYDEPSDREALVARLEREGTVSNLELRLRRRDGTHVWVLANLSLRGDEPGIFQGTVFDITDKKRAEAQIEYQAYHDVLTGLPNRRLFLDRLDVSLARVSRGRRPISVMYLDLDHFKRINDTLGHTLGDAVLHEIGNRLQACVRDGDTVSRAGGDEFTILLSDLAEQSDTIVVAQKVLDTIARPLSVAGHELFVTTSIGIAIFPEDGETPEVLLKNADGAMYRAKDLGRNRYQLCTPELAARALERLSLESTLRHAVERSELEVHYQPRLDLATRRISGAEALARWNHPDRGMVGPSVFIALAEDTPLIYPIGDWVLRTACRNAKQWPGFEGPGILRVAVNLSARQFQQPGLCAAIARILEENDLPPSRLELEITESVAMRNVDVTLQILKELHAMGVRIAIDDFGTGHSSLGYLKRFPIDTVKIDRVFVNDVHHGASDAAIVAAVVTMAHRLKLRVVAEGVENEAQLRYLEALGCDEVQGFFFSEPLPLDAFGSLLTSRIRESRTSP